VSRALWRVGSTRWLGGLPDTTGILAPDLNHLFSSGSLDDPYGGCSSPHSVAHWVCPYLRLSGGRI